MLYSEYIDEYYLTKRKTIEDDFGRKRYVGEVVLSTIPQLELNYVLSKIKDCNFHDNTEERNYFLTIQKYLNINSAELLNIIKNYVEILKEKPETYSIFSKIFSSTCKVTFIDYDQSEYSLFTKKTQSDIDHYKVGAYMLFVEKPIPLKVISKMKDEVDKYNALHREQDIKRYDKQNSSKELNDYAEEL